MKGRERGNKRTVFSSLGLLSFSIGLYSCHFMRMRAHVCVRVCPAASKAVCKIKWWLLGDGGGIRLMVYKGTNL